MKQNKNLEHLTAVFLNQHAKIVPIQFGFPSGNFND